MLGMILLPPHVYCKALPEIKCQLRRVKIEMILTINVESKTLMDQVNKMVSKLLYFDRILIRLIRS